MFSFAFFRFYLCYLPRYGTQTAHTRHRCEHLLAGWIKDQDNDKTGRRGQGWTARQRRRQRPPAPHRREQLLAGWRQASRTAKTGRGRNDKREGEPRRQKKTGRGQDNTNTNNEGADDDNDSGDQGKTNDEEDVIEGPAKQDD